jgi:hypothetical protein
VLPTKGRWKIGGDDSCYFDAADSGLDQCVPVESAAAETAPDAAAAAQSHEVPVPASVVEHAVGEQRQPPGAASLR